MSLTFQRQCAHVAPIGPKGIVAYPAAVLVATGISSLGLGIVFFAREVHQASASRIGLLAATWSLSYVLGCLFLRPLADRLLPRHSIVLATLCMGGAIALVLVAPRLWLVYLLYVVYGLGTSFFWPPLMGWLSTGIEGASLNRAMGFFNLSWSSGGILGPALAGCLASYDPRYPIALGASLYGIACVTILVAIHILPGLDSEDGDHHQAVAGAGRILKPGREGSFLRYPAWAGLVATYVVLGVLINIFPLAAQEQLQMSKPAVGFLLFLRALTTTAALLILGRTTAWHFRGGQLLIGLAVFAAAVLALPAARSALSVSVVMVLIGVLVAQSYVNSLFHGVTGSRHRAARMAIHESLLSVGLVIGGAVGGAVYQYGGYAQVCRFAAAVLLLGCLFGAALLMTARRRGRCLGAATGGPPGVEP